MAVARKKEYQGSGRKRCSVNDPALQRKDPDVATAFDIDQRCDGFCGNRSAAGDDERPAGHGREPSFPCFPGSECREHAQSQEEEWNVLEVVEQNPRQRTGKKARE